MEVHSAALETLPPALRTKVRLRAEEASEYLRLRYGVTVAVQTLAKRRMLGQEPTYARFGRTILYTRQDLDAWAIEQLAALHHE